MKTMVLVLSLFAAVLFAAINNNTKSVSNTGSRLNGPKNLGENLNPGDNIYDTDNQDINSGYGSGSYTPVNSNYSGDSYTSDASFLPEDSTYNYETPDLDESTNTEDTISLMTLENSLSSDGEFVSINENEIDPENISVGESGAAMDDDIYTNKIWVPNSHYTSEGWNPYTNGRWVWTQRGWSWVSNYRWGWATYHYGRWWYSPVYGWVWSPGRRYAPAWVFWNHNNGYEGWYPITPRIRHRKWHFTNWNNHNFNNNHWVFVKSKDFLKEVNVSTVMPYKKNKEILSDTKPVIGLKREGKILFNSGPDVKLISKVNDNNLIKKDFTKVTTKEVKNVNSKNTSGTEKKINVKTTQNNNVKTIEKKMTKDPATKSEIIKKNNENNPLNRKDIKINTKTTNTTVKEKTVQPVNDKKSEVKSENKKKTETNTGAVNNTGVKNENKNVKSGNINSDIKTVPKVEQPPKIKNDSRVNSEPRVKTEPKNNNETKVKTEPRVNTEPKVKTEPKNNNETKVKTEPKVNTESKVNNAPKNEAPPSNSNNKKENNKNK